MLDTRLLIAIDDSEDTKRAIEYIAKFVGRRKGFHVCLVHVLRPLPPELLEHGGSEDPSQEVLLESDSRTEPLDCRGKKRCPKTLDQAGAVLRKAGVPAGAQQGLFSVNRGMGEKSLTGLSIWPRNAGAARLLSADSQFRGFTSYSAETCRKNSFVTERDSVFGRLNDSIAPSRV